MNISGTSDPEIPFFLGQQLRNATLPKSVDARLVGELTVMIARRMKRHMQVGHIMAGFSGKFQYAVLISEAEAFCKPANHGLQPPGPDSMCLQAVGSKFFNRLPVLPRKVSERVDSVMIHVDIMPWTF